MSNIIAGFRSTSDGWRAVIAEDFTFANVYRISWAIGQYIISNTKNTGVIKVLVANDTRFMGEVFSKIIINSLTELHIHCHYIPYPVPTPILSWFTYEKKYDIGIMVTASHNPPQYNGIKIRMPYGGPPENDVINAIEGYISSEEINFPLKNSPDEIVDPKPAYLDMVRSLVDLQAIDQAAPVIAVDPMHGTTGNLLSELLKDTKAKVIQIRANQDPLFGGISPEPRKATIEPLSHCVNQNRCIIGVSHDGDGDRIVAFDSIRGFLSPHDLLTVMAYDLAERRNLPGDIIGSVSVTGRVRRVADIFGRDYHEVAVGFRNAAQIMRSQKILIAGEENGGIGVGMHMPERDGTLVATLLLECIATRNMSIGVLLNDIENQVGRTSFLRRDIGIQDNQDIIIKKMASNIPQSIAGSPISYYSQKDGIKIYLQNGSWVLLRAAGTEPLIRIYCESSNESLCNLIIDEVINVFGGT